MAKKIKVKLIKELEELDIQIKDGATSKIELAYKFGYVTPATIDAWFRKNKIPGHALDRVRDFLDADSVERRA